MSSSSPSTSKYYFHQKPAKDWKLSQATIAYRNVYTDTSLSAVYTIMIEDLKALQQARPGIKKLAKAMIEEIEVCG